ncbi:hypothetical protein FD755_012612, partial [Muntiacus reevesi]
MAFQAVCILVGVFVCSTYVKGSPQPQARVYLTFDDHLASQSHLYFYCSFQLYLCINVSVTGHI